MKNLTTYATLLTAIATFVTAFCTLYVHHSNNRRDVIKDVYDNVIFKIYLILKSEIENIKKDSKYMPDTSTTLSFKNVTTKINNILDSSNDKYPSALRTNFYNLKDNPNPKNFKYFCIYIDDYCKKAQRVIGYDLQYIPYGKTRTVSHWIFFIGIILTLILILILMVSALINIISFIDYIVSVLTLIFLWFIFYIVYILVRP